MANSQLHVGTPELKVNPLANPMLNPSMPAILKKQLWEQMILLFSWSSNTLDSLQEAYNLTQSFGLGWWSA
jgi:hypothetical protein